MELFGFEIKRKAEEKEEKKKVSFVPRDSEDGAGYVVNAGGYFGQYLDTSGAAVKNEADLIMKYRDIASQPECDQAIEDIVNEAVVSDEDSAPVEIMLDDVDQPDRIKKLITNEFDEVVNLLNLNWYGHDIFRRWYIDGRLFYHKIIDEKQPKRGIIELRPIDPTRIRKVKELIKNKDPKTGTEIVVGEKEFYIYQDKKMNKSNQGLKISPDSICYVTSGVLDPTRKKVLSHLHKALKPVNQLRMMEDSLVIYRLSRAPERRIFYIDVGNLPKGKAEEYVKGIMNNYRNKMVYDAQTGEMKDDRKHMSMLEDFWLPRREGGRGTEITTLPGGENLGQIDDIVYFQKKLYKSLHVPVNRLEQEAQFSLGRSSEITRDELKFQKFINRLRKKFSTLFVDLLRTNLILKGIVTEEEWLEIRDQINFDFLQDTHFAELKNAELLREKIGTLRELDEFVGKYYSEEWVRKNVLMQTDEDIEEIDKQIKKEGDEEDDMGGDDLGGNEPAAAPSETPSATTAANQAAQAQSFKLVPDVPAKPAEK